MHGTDLFKTCPACIYTVFLIVPILKRVFSQLSSLAEYYDRVARYILQQHPLRPTSTLILAVSFLSVLRARTRYSSCYTVPLCVLRVSHSMHPLIILTIISSISRAHNEHDSAIGRKKRFIYWCLYLLLTRVF